MKRFILTSAATAACGILVLGAAVPCVSASSVPTTQAAHSDVVSDSASICRAVAALASDALTANDMNRLTSSFYHPDAQRIRQSATYSQGYGSKLDAQVKQLSADWKQKYGNDFSAKGLESAMTYSTISIRQGEFGHDSSLAALVNRNSSAVEAKKISADQQIGEVRFSPANGLAEVRVPLIRESMNRWRVDVPDSLDASQLRSNLAGQLSALSANYAHWPADENQAYREVAQRVAMAVLDYPTPRASASAQQPKSTAAMATARPAQASAVSTTATPTHSWWKFWSGW